MGKARAGKAESSGRSAGTRAQTAKAAPAKAEAARPGKAEPAKAEPARPEPAKAAAGKPEAKAVAKGQLITFDDFLAKLGTKDRETVTRQLTGYEEAGQASRAKLWRRLASVLATLAPHLPQVAGRQAVRFFVADGKHRLQVFALEDGKEGLAVYTKDVLPEAQKAGMIGAAVKGEEPPRYKLPGGSETLSVEPLTAEGTASAPEYYRHMLGWNRKAIRITLGSEASDAQLKAVEAICGMGVAK